MKCGHECEEPSEEGHHRCVPGAIGDPFGNLWPATLGARAVRDGLKKLALLGR